MLMCAATAMGHCMLMPKSAVQYAEQAKALVEIGVSVVVFDLLGCGDSTKPRPADRKERLKMYSPQENYLDCIAVMDQFTQVWTFVH